MFCVKLAFSDRARQSREPSRRDAHRVTFTPTAVAMMLIANKATKV
jgi:hypothetical protein